MKYIHGTAVKIEEYRVASNAVFESLVELAGEYEIGINSTSGNKQIIPKCQGVPRPDAQGTETYALAYEKFGADGFYILNSKEYAQTLTKPNGEKTFSPESLALLPSPSDFELAETDDITQWVEPEDGA